MHLEFKMETLKDIVWNLGRSEGSKRTGFQDNKIQFSSYMDWVGDTGNPKDKTLRIS